MVVGPSIISIYSKLLVFSFSEYLVWCRVGMVASTWLPYSCFILRNLLSTENIVGSFIADPFLVFIIFGKLFFNFIVCIFGTVAVYVLIVGSSLLEMELLSLIMIECVLSSFW